MHHKNAALETDEEENAQKIIPHAVLNPEREKVRQNGRRIKAENEPMFTLTSQDRHGVLMIKEATKSGCKPAHPRDSVDLSFAEQNTRRGRVGKISPTRLIRVVRREW